MGTVCVTSAPGNTAARAAVRTSWGAGALLGSGARSGALLGSGATLGVGVNVVFLVGRTADPELQGRLENEARTHQDILQVSRNDICYGVFRQVTVCCAGGFPGQLRQPHHQVADDAETVLRQPGASVSVEGNTAI